MDVVGGVHPCADCLHESFNLCIGGAGQCEFGNPDGLAGLCVGGLDMSDEVVGVA